MTAPYGRLVVDDMYGRVVHIVGQGQDGNWAMALCGFMPWPGEWINYSKGETNVPACLGCTNKLRKRRT